MSNGSLINVTNNLAKQVCGVDVNSEPVPALPLDVLEQYVDKVIVVEYLNGGERKIDRGILSSIPTAHSFYLRDPNSTDHSWIMHWFYKGDGIIKEQEVIRIMGDGKDLYRHPDYKSIADRIN